MFERFEILIVRLITGEDVICFCYKDYKNSRAYILYPKIFLVGDEFSENSINEISLFDWLPSAAFSSQEIVLPLSSVLFSSLPTVYLGCMYLEQLTQEIDNDSEIYKTIKQTLDQYNQVPQTETIH